MRFLKYISLLLFITGQAHAQEENSSIILNAKIDNILKAGRTGDFQTAIKEARQGIELANLHQKDSLQASFHFYAGMGYNELSRLDSSLYFLNIADSIAQAIGFAKMEARVKFILIDIYQLQLGDLRKSQQLIDLVKPVVHKLNDDSYLGRLEGKMAYQERQNQNYDKALSHYLAELKTVRKSGIEVNEGIVLQNIGVVLSDLKKFEESIEYYKNSILLCEKNNYHHRTPISYLNIADAYYCLSNMDSAKYYYTKAITISKKFNNEVTLGSAYEGLAHITLSKDSVDLLPDEIKTSNEYLDKSYEISQRLNNNYLKFETLFSLGKNARLNRKYKESEKYLTQALALAREMNIKKYLIAISQALAQLNMDRSRYKEASKFLDDVSQYKDSLYIETMLKSTSELEAKYNSEHKQEEINRLEAEKKLETLKQKNKQQRYFIIAGLAIILLLITGFMLYVRHRKQITKKDNELQELTYRVHQTRQIALRSQMNPHFIFNLMTTIDDYILKNEKKLASELLTSFADLIRLVLENSEQDMISLQEELETLELYLKIEQIRFNKSFEFTINTDSSIDFDVPPLILQPYVENAIIHGLNHSLGRKKMIEVTTEMTGDDTLILFIRDNGIGIKKSSELNSRVRADHESMGTRITEERMRLLQTIKGMKTSVTTSDLPEGTEVKIELRIL